MESLKINGDPLVTINLKGASQTDYDKAISTFEAHS